MRITHPFSGRRNLNNGEEHAPSRCVFAVAAALLAATVAVGVLDAWLKIRVFLIYVIAVAGVTAACGGRAGVVIALLAWLLSAYLFVPPRLDLAFDGSLLALMPYYLGSALIAYLARLRLEPLGAIEHRVARRRARNSPSDN